MLLAPGLLVLGMYRANALLQIGEQGGGSHAVHTFTPGLMTGARALGHRYLAVSTAHTNYGLWSLLLQQQGS